MSSICCMYDMYVISVCCKCFMHALERLQKFASMCCSAAVPLSRANLSSLPPPSSNDRAILSSCACLQSLFCHPYHPPSSTGDHSLQATKAGRCIEAGCLAAGELPLRLISFHCQSYTIRTHLAAGVPRRMVASGREVGAAGDKPFPTPAACCLLSIDSVI
jgi:hypothetical protein